MAADLKRGLEMLDHVPAGSKACLPKEGKEARYVLKSHLQKQFTSVLLRCFVCGSINLKKVLAFGKVTNSGLKTSTPNRQTNQAGNSLEIAT